MLNLTPDPIVLIAESGKTEIPASGYTARVEYERKTVAFEQAYSHDRDRLKYVEVPVIEEAPKEIAFKTAQGYDLLEVPGLNLNEEWLLVTREVAEAAARKHECADGSLECDWASQPGGVCSKKGKPHPLAARMVWADNPERKPVWFCPRCGEADIPGSHVTYEETHDKDGCDATVTSVDTILGYRELRRVSGVGR